MRALTALAAACLAALMICSCASEKPAAGSLAAIGDSVGAGASGAAALDELFVARYGAVASQLVPRESAAQPDPDAVEARSLVAAAEEMYLYGKTLVAIRLLDEAATLLRRNR